MQKLSLSSLQHLMMIDWNSLKYYSQTTIDNLKDEIAIAMDSIYCYHSLTEEDNRILNHLSKLANHINSL